MQPCKRASCAVCGRGPHRYGTTDPEHKYDGVGCVNMLLPEIDALREALGDIVNASRDDGLAAMCNWMRGRAAAALAENYGVVHGN